MEAQLNDEAMRDLYRPIVTAMVDRWSEGKPLNPDSGKANGYYRLTAWLLDYLVLHRSMPQGLHQMPEGRDRFNRIERSFPVDFDELSRGLSLPA
ncbi:MAG: hypothetical protein C1942_03530 [Prosthecochloris sp.]|uniref:hypothetical protein n=1 Tax=Prosthecochloris sp. TaxID=290513 RepID=UPI0013CB3A7A|nr:hypothetical protein [Prosthecochloris sp.]NEX11761.1 hypothetical protein [Prosthecochloris sp.]